MPRVGSSGQHRRRKPLRRCVVCQDSRPKAELVRAARQSSGVLSIGDEVGSSGRGAYVCRSAECWRDEAIVRRLEQALRTNFDAADLEQVEAYAGRF